jgi:tRNA modification GTPase
MKGSYSSGINTLREHLVELAALLELELDFSEEEVEFADRSKLRLIMQQLKSEINTMCQSFRSGNALKEGIPVAIVGAPNVGKSTLLNALVGEQRAIISDIAGTTRDTIEEVLFINGVKFRIIDTAGIRSSEDVIESMGIERSKKAVERAEIVLIVCDGNSVEIPEDLSLEQKRVIVVFNKRDINTNPVAPYQGEQVMISAKENQGTDELRRLLSRPYQDVCNQAVTVTNARHYEVLQRSEAELAIAEQALDNGLSADLVVEHIRVIINNLGEITGEITSDEILGTIFAKFCIGK